MLLNGAQGGSEKRRGLFDSNTKPRFNEAKPKLHHGLPRPKPQSQLRQDDISKIFGNQENFNMIKTLLLQQQNNQSRDDRQPLDSRSRESSPSKLSSIHISEGEKVNKNRIIK